MALGHAAALTLGGFGQPRLNAQGLAAMTDTLGIDHGQHVGLRTARPGIGM
jgi:hypothetical protein